MPFSAVALLCVRNEAIHIERCIRCLIQEGIEVMVIDHASTDTTLEHVDPYVGKGVVDIARLPYTGAFSLTSQLKKKQDELLKLPHDWVVHVDADEWLHSKSQRPLLYELAKIDHEGYNAVDFDEFVFLPIGDEDFQVPNYHKKMLRYYFYRRSISPLVRSWKRNSGFQNIRHAGHKLVGSGLNLYPARLALRHYICLSRAHFVEKYRHRVFATDELAKGWHLDRERIKGGYDWSEDDAGFNLLPAWDSREFDLSRRKKRHFWEKPPQVWPAIRDLIGELKSAYT